MNKQRLAAIDAALAELPDDTIQPHEFTARDLQEAKAASGKPISYQKASRHLDAQANNGTLKRRKCLVNNKMTNVYSKP